MIREFEHASGQRINREKSAIVPTKRLSRQEVARCHEQWGWALRISHRERLLGVYLGLDTGIEDQYKDAMDKFDVNVKLFTLARHTFSMVTRIIVVNVFLVSLFSYVNRLFFMPAKVLREVEKRLLNFLTPVAWTKLGMLTVVKDFYGVKCEVVDLRRANVASVCATHERLTAVRQGTVLSLGRWRGAGLLAHPAVSWSAAFAYYLRATGQTFADTLCEARRRGRGENGISEYRVVYKSLRSAEKTMWTNYLQARVRAKGWDPDVMLRQLGCLPRSVPQGHRWFLLKVHFNAPLTTARTAAAGISATEPCAFCKAQDGDSWRHLLRCDLVMDVCDRFCAAGRLPPIQDGQPELMMQNDKDGATVAGVVAVFASIWRVRAACRRLRTELSADKLFDLVVRCLDCPWLVRCLPTDSKQTRRSRKAREPQPCPNTAIYRSDGASRGQGQGGESQAGWGAAVWRPALDGLGSGPPFATSFGYLGPDVSNNIAEYHGLIQCLQRALRAGDPTITAQVDSMLVSQQTARHGGWACRSDVLIPLRDECRNCVERLAEAGITCTIVHIYREYNQVADGLANRAVNERISGASPTW